MYIGAQGPKVLDLAGRIGDGALINASNPKDFAIAIPIIKAACDKVGKKNFDIGAYTAMSIDQSEKKAAMQQRSLQHSSQPLSPTS